MITITPYNNNINFTNRNTIKNQNNRRVDKASTPTSTNNKAIDFDESCALFCRGVYNQLKDTIVSIIDHPFKTLAVIGVTTAAIMSLPLVGIPTAVGGSVLTLGFAGFAISKGIYHSIQFSKNNKKGSYDTARKQLENIGQDTVDIALSAPFIPKALKNMKDFVKYGNFHINSELFNEISKAKNFKAKYNLINSADNEITRNIKFQSKLDTELAKLKDLTPAEKTAMKKELLEFNVTEDRLPELVLDKWAKIKGITTKPDLKYESYAATIYGYADPNICTILLNDFKKEISGTPFDNFKLISQKIEKGKYIMTYEDQTTKTNIVESIDIGILDSYNRLILNKSKLSPEAFKILTILHEREHIHQFTQISALKGFEWMKHTIKPRGRELMTKMIAEMPKIDPLSPEATKISTYLNRATNGTPVAYIKEPIEIGARNVEIETMKRTDFKILDTIYKYTHKDKVQPFKEFVLLNDVRFESANN